MPRKLHFSAALLRRGTDLRDDLTGAQARMWDYLRLKRTGQPQFRRQHAIGRYVVDFCSPEARLIIEVDARRHVDQTERDLERTRYLEFRGYRLLRFWNSEVLNDMDGVVRAVQTALAES